MTFILSSLFVSLLSSRLMFLFWTIASQGCARNIFSEKWLEGIRALGWAVSLIRSLKCSFRFSGVTVKRRNEAGVISQVYVIVFAVAWTGLLNSRAIWYISSMCLAPGSWCVPECFWEAWHKASWLCYISILHRAWPVSPCLHIALVHLDIH